MAYKTTYLFNFPNEQTLISPQDKFMLTNFKEEPNLYCVFSFLIKNSYTSLRLEARFYLEGIKEQILFIPAEREIKIKNLKDTQRQYISWLNNEYSLEQELKNKLFIKERNIHSLKDTIYFVSKEKKTQDNSDYIKALKEIIEKEKKEMSILRGFNKKLLFSNYKQE